MLICKRCKTENAAGSHYCSGCGERLSGAHAAPAEAGSDWTQAAGVAPLSEDGWFCTQCGHKNGLLSPFCPVCGRER